MAIKLKYNESTLSKNLDVVAERLGAVVLMYAATKASEIEAKMKMDRPWTDRTNMAKTMLTARVSRPQPNLVRITLAHGVTYGMWLELAHEKRFAVVGPTVRSEAPKIISDLQGLMSQLKL